MTSRYRCWYWIFAILSFLCNVAPLATYTFIGLAENTLIYEKVALVMTVFAVVVMSVISWVNKIAMKSRMWILLLGIYACLDYILVPLVIIAICQVVDELLFSPLRERYRTKLTISKEMDKRGVLG